MLFLLLLYLNNMEIDFMVNKQYIFIPLQLAIYLHIIVKD